MKKILLSVLVLAFFLPGAIVGQTENVDLEMVYKIKQEGLKNSQIADLSFWMTDFVGPRLTASNGKKAADEWTSKRMKEYGLENVRVEKARDFSRGGWDNLKSYAAMTAPYYCNFAVTPVAWTGSTKGLVKGKAVLIDIKSEGDLEKLKGTLKNKIAIMPTVSGYDVSFEPLASRYTDEELAEIMIYRQRSRGAYGDFDREAFMRQRQLQRQISDFLLNEGVAVLVNGSGSFNVVRSGGGNYSAGEKEPPASINLSTEAHGRLVRLLQHNVDVEMEVDIRNSFYDSPAVTNVIGEIPGTDPDLKDQVVLIGGHLDSWHGGTGAADNASGCIVMMEAMRILKSLNINPRRTIRIALWGGEEQGLHGSRGYVEKYLQDPETREFKDGYKNFALYLNMDNGTGKFRGIYTQENEMIAPIFEQMLKPFADMECTTVTKRNTSGTDHQSFDPLGLPAFQFIQDEIEYGRGYHTNMDTYERLVMPDLQHNAVVVAAMAYHAAMRDEMMPRKPIIESMQRNRSRF